MHPGLDHVVKTFSIYILLYTLIRSISPLVHIVGTVKKYHLVAKVRLSGRTFGYLLVDEDSMAAGDKLEQIYVWLTCCNCWISEITFETMTRFSKLTSSVPLIKSGLPSSMLQSKLVELIHIQCQIL